MHNADCIISAGYFKFSIVFAFLVLIFPFYHTNLLLSHINHVPIHNNLVCILILLHHAYRILWLWFSH